MLMEVVVLSELTLDVLHRHNCVETPFDDGALVAASGRLEQLKICSYRRYEKNAHGFRGRRPINKAYMPEWFGFSPSNAFQGKPTCRKSNTNRKN